MNILKTYESFDENIMKFNTKEQTYDLIQNILDAFGIDYDSWSDEEHNSDGDTKSIFEFETNKNAEHTEEKYTVIEIHQDPTLNVILFKEGDIIGDTIGDGNDLIELLKKYEWVNTYKYMKQLNTDKIKTFESWSITQDGRLDIADSGPEEIDFETGEHYFVELKKRWNVGSPRQTTTLGVEYNFPVEAQEDLDSFGITWYNKERVTNDEHPDYGKEYLALAWVHKDLSKRS